MTFIPAGCQAGQNEQLKIESPALYGHKWEDGCKYLCRRFMQRTGASAGAGQSLQTHRVRKTSSQFKLGRVQGGRKKARNSQGNKTHTFIVSSANPQSSVVANKSLDFMVEFNVSIHILRLANGLVIYSTLFLAFIKFSFRQSHKFFRSFSPLPHPHPRSSANSAVSGYVFIMFAPRSRARAILKRMAVVFQLIFNSNSLISAIMV